jgi:hypothetical protein
MLLGGLLQGGFDRLLVLLEDELQSGWAKLKTSGFI